MRTFTFIAVAVMSMWISGEANAQKPAKQTQSDNQTDGENARQGRRGRRGQGQQGQARGRGQQGQVQGKKQRRGGPQMMEMLFTRFDSDKNGSISLEEAPERMKQRFEKLDANSDKSVSKEELQAAFQMMGGEQGKGKKGEGKKGRGQMMDPAKMIQKADANKDGVISLDEAPERMKKNFDRMDADASGTVTADELKAAFEKMKRKGGGAAGRNRSANPEDKLPKQPKRPPMADKGA